MLDVDEIVPGLWQGSFPASGYAVADAGFDVLVFCARGFQPEASRYPGLAKIIYAPNDDWPWSPITRENMDVAERAAGEVISCLQRGSKVLVSCVAGINRSAFVVGLAIHGHLGYAGYTCIDVIRQNRKLDAPGTLVLSNPYFLRALATLPGTTPSVGS